MSWQQKCEDNFPALVVLLQRWIPAETKGNRASFTICACNEESSGERRESIGLCCQRKQQLQYSTEAFLPEQV